MRPPALIPAAALRILAAASVILTAALPRIACADADADPGFRLTATAQDFDRYVPAYLANGYVSTVSTPRATEGTPGYLVAFMDYLPDDVSRPAAIPGWTEIDYSTGPSRTGQAWLNRTPMRASHFTDYRQVMDLQAATLTTSYTYRDRARRTAIVVTTFVDEAQPHLAATQLSITPDFDGVVQLSFALNLWAPHQPRLPLGRLTGPQMEEMVAAQGQTTEPQPPATPDRAATWYHGDTHVLAKDGDAASLTLWLSGRAEHGLDMAEATAISLPAGLAPESVSVHHTDYRLALDVSVRVARGHTYTFGKFVAFSRAGWGGDADADRQLALAARDKGFDALLAQHRDAWRDLWRADILIDGDARAQQTVHSELYYLLASSTPDTAWPIGACGMTLGYLDHAFWDSDTWIFPALLLLHPERARSLVTFRARTLAPARARAAERHLDGAMFPWEADPENGTEQTPHTAVVLADSEIHVNGDVALAQWQYYLASGDLAWLKADGWPVIRDVARYWASRATWVAQKHRYEILHTNSVDEPYNDIANDTFTSAGAARTLAIAGRAAALVGERPDPRWADVAARLYLPTGGNPPHHLAFDPSVETEEGPGGGGTTLLTFPSLDLPMTDAQRRADYHSALPPGTTTGAAGNSMGYAPNSIAAATVGDTAGAVDWFEGNFTGGTLKGPFNVRTETATNNTAYFMTGSAGYLQNLLYGFTGLRIREQGLVEAYPPLLPERWQGLTLRNIQFRGEHYDIRVARDAKGQVRLSRQKVAAP